MPFALERVKMQGYDIKQWAEQSDNPLLKKLAQEVLEAAKEVNNSDKTQDRAEDAENGGN